jgi:phenylalanyl-tRNA synthetase alpha chain
MSMQQVKEEIEKVHNLLTNALRKAQTQKEIEQVRINFLGKKGSIPALFQKLKTLSTEEKHVIGPLLNELKQHAEEKIKESKTEFIDKQAKAAEQKKRNFDVTAYKTGVPQGSLHLFTSFIEEIENIFLSMGFDVFDGPEVETDEYNFSALNIPQDHPARDMVDTLWLTKPGMLLRTHTSTIQIHAMKKGKLPLAGIATGRTYRHEAIDASHDFTFMQCEGVLIDKNITLSHLFAYSKHLLQALFNTTNLDIRIRPGYFPFVEPGVEIDMRCPFCTNGCPVCKKTTWVEIFPGGLIHPNVLNGAGIDSEKYSGFAFGFGLTRLAMLKYGINDIRLFYSGKLKFLRQF